MKTERFTRVLLVLVSLLTGLSDTVTGIILDSVGLQLGAESPWDEALIGPSFDYSSPDLITASVGQIAYLSCRVRQLGDRKVSWIRKRDLHILTVGSQGYTNDNRFTVVSSMNGDTWNLRIRSVQLRDAGLYECQVSSEPKISRTVRLKVTAATAVIQGSPEVYIRTGSHINLTCIVKDTSHTPANFIWYRADIPINAPASSTYKTHHQAMESILVIRDAEPKDSGNFTCAPDGVEPASILVHVLNGDRPAAMQHGHNKANHFGATTEDYCLFTTLVYLVHFTTSRQLI